MAPEGMVHALLGARAWLNSAGRLVDLRPTSEAAVLEVHLASGTVAAGCVVDLEGQAGPQRRHAQAEAAAAAAVALVLSYSGFVPSPGKYDTMSVFADSVRLMLPVSVLSGIFFTMIGRAVEREVGAAEVEMEVEETQRHQRGRIP